MLEQEDCFRVSIFTILLDLFDEETATTVESKDMLINN